MGIVEVKVVDETTRSFDSVDLMRKFIFSECLGKSMAISYYDLARGHTKVIFCDVDAKGNACNATGFGPRISLNFNDMEQALSALPPAPIGPPEKFKFI